MCGFVGYLLPAGDPGPLADRLPGALELVRHRGPDGSGTWLSGDRRVGLAHARLTVIDPEGGAQPMVDPETGCVVVTNGEIYNYRELFEEQARRGRPPRSRSDTEALLAGFARDGKGVLARLEGMFAFAAYDPRDGTLLLARDRLGQKPLYHAPLSGGGVAFASELPALLGLLERSPEPDGEALSIYLAFGYVPAPWTGYRGVRKLPAAHFLRAGAGEVERYWRRPAPDFSARPPDPEDLRERIREAVKARLVSDVPLGAFLSGGIDSATVVAMMAGEASGPVRTFTVASPHPEYDESARARVIARRFGTEHTEIRIEPPEVEEIPELLRRFGEPFGDSSALAQALVARAAREHVTVALTGDGGDEAFAGYDRFSILARVDRVPRRAARTLRPLLPGRGRRVMDLALMEPWRRYLEFYESFNGGARDRLLAPAFAARHGDAPARFLRGLYTSFPGEEPDRMLAVDSTTWLADDLNVKVDMTSMAVALECRAPLQDHRLVEWCARVPARRHLAGRRKALLARAVRDRLPREVLAGEKRGFAAPVEHWFRGDLEGFLCSKLRSPALAALEVVTREGVDRVLHGLREGLPTGRPRIQAFLLLALAIWAEGLR